MKTFLLLLTLVSLTACHKKPDAPTPALAQATQPSTPNPNPPPPVSNCQGSTVLWHSPANDTINDNSSKDYLVPGFEVSCNDSARVYMRLPNGIGVPWTEYFNVDNGASYFSIAGQTITVHNRTGIVLEVYIEAVLN